MHNKTHYDKITYAIFYKPPGFMMKISISRRQRAFIAKWGGVVIAAILIIPIAGFGGTFLLANSRIDSTLNYVTQAVNLVDIISAGTTSDLPPDYVYHLKLIVHNGTSSPADVIINDASIAIEKFAYEINGSAGWSGHIEANGNATFEGDITVKREQLKEFEDKWVTVKITGIITVKARYGFVDKEQTGLVRLSPKVMFPRPTAVTPESPLTATLNG